MGFLDGFLNLLNVDEFGDDDEAGDDEYLEEDLDDYDTPEEEDEEPVRERSGLFGRMKRSRAEEDDELYDDEEDEPRPARETLRRKRERTSARDQKRQKEQEGRAAKRAAEREKRERERAEAKSTRQAAAEARQRKSKITPIGGRKTQQGTNGGVKVVRPTSMEDTSEIADYMLAGSTVVLNLEGLDIDIAQRVIDFTCGVCYSLGGNLQKIASYIFILTPQGVDISGDYQSILGGAVDLTSMRSAY